MSQTRKTLKSIASGEQYKNLVAAVEKGDYAGIMTGYAEVAKLVQEAESEIVEKIQSLPRQNRDEERRKFHSAFASRAGTELPQWYWLNAELQKSKVMDGVVFGFGTRGDPLARSPEGRVVVLGGAKLKEGDRVKFRVTSEGDKVDFGTLFELTPESFYFVLSQDTRLNIRDSLASIRERSSAAANGSTNLSQLLKELDSVAELASKLQADERDRVVAQVAAFRRNLVESSIAKLIFDFISREEKREISETCQCEAVSETLPPGLFRRETHDALKTRLFAGQNIRGYSEALVKLESKVDSMDSAVRVLDFKASVDKVYPGVRSYLERMDRLFERLSKRVRDCALRLAGEGPGASGDVESVIANDFSIQSLSSELRRAFRSAEEFFDMRGSLEELMSMLGDEEGLRAEAALKPYLRQITGMAFGKKAELAA